MISKRKREGKQKPDADFNHLALFSAASGEVISPTAAAALRTPTSSPSTVHSPSTAPRPRSSRIWGQQSRLSPNGKGPSKGKGKGKDGKKGGGKKKKTGNDDQGEWSDSHSRAGSQKWCMFFPQGKCKKGEDCSYRHY